MRLKMFTFLFLILSCKIINAQNQTDQNEIIKWTIPNYKE